MGVNQAFDNYEAVNSWGIFTSIVGWVCTTDSRLDVYHLNCKKRCAASCFREHCLPEAPVMERIHMNHIRDIIHRLRQGQSERQICRDTHIARQTIHKYKQWAEAQGYLSPDSPLPDHATLAEALGPAIPPARRQMRRRHSIVMWHKLSNL